MGKYMEKMLTTEADMFNKYYVLDMLTNQPQMQMTDEVKAELMAEDYYRYMRSGKMILRSQIDTRGKDENGKDIVFELKTRASAPLRYDIMNYIDYLDYEVAKFRGKHSSFEREYYDLIRGGFLKYIMQMKIGQMQGAAIAYHNTQKVFGFQYVKLEEMEKRVFGCSQFSNIVFKSSLSILERILDYILDDQDSHRKVVQSGSTDVNQNNKKVFKMGFYAHEIAH